MQLVSCNLLKYMFCTCKSILHFSNSFIDFCRLCCYWLKYIYIKITPTHKCQFQTRKHIANLRIYKIQKLSVSNCILVNINIYNLNSGSISNKCTTLIDNRFAVTSNDWYQLQLEISNFWIFVSTTQKNSWVPLIL